MPTLSQKAELMPASPIRKLVPYADAAKKRGVMVHHLNIGQPDIETPAVALKPLHNFNDQVIEYTHSAGLLNYREGLAKYYTKVGIDVIAANIMITTGGSEALTIAFMTACNEGDQIIIPEPFYANYNGFATQSGLTIVPVTSYIEDGFKLPPIEDFEQKITARTKAIVICNPGNPTGYLYNHEELLQLRDLVRKHDLFLIADEVYREFCYDGAEPMSVLNLPELGDHVVLVDSVSKRYSMCGVRIGALISRNAAFMDAALKFAQARLSPPYLGQIAAMGALDTPQSYFDNVIEKYIERRNIMVDGLNAISGVFCPKPRGAFYCVARLPIQDSEDFCQWLLESFEYEGQTVMMAPASGFYATLEMGKNEVRIAYVLDKEALKNALKCLEEALKIYPGTVR